MVSYDGELCDVQGKNGYWCDMMSCNRVFVATRCN